MFDSAERAPFKIISLLALAPLVYLFFRGSELGHTICDNVWAIHLAKLDWRPEQCIHHQLPLHLSLYVGNLSGELDSIQSTPLGQVNTRGHPLVIHTIGMAWLQQKNATPAAQLWKAARYYSGLEEVAQQLVEGQMYDDAVEFVDARQELGGFDASDWQFYWTMIQLELYTTRDIERILSLVDKATTLNPQTQFLYTHTGRILWEQKEYLASNRVYHAGLRKFPRESAFWFGLARNASSTNEATFMCLYFQNGLQMNYNASACNIVQEHCQRLVSPELLNFCKENGEE